MIDFSQMKKINSEPPRRRTRFEKFMTIVNKADVNNNTRILLGEYAKFLLNNSKLSAERFEVMVNDFLAIIPKTQWNNRLNYCLDKEYRVLTFKSDTEGSFDNLALSGKKREKVELELDDEVF